MNGNKPIQKAVYVNTGLEAGAIFSKKVFISGAVIREDQRSGIHCPPQRKILLNGIKI